MTVHTPSTWFITGASSGIGLALTQAAAGRGDNVVALARDAAPLGTCVDQHGARVLPLSADVRRGADVDDAVSRAVEAFGRIDVVANNAGYGAVRSGGGVDRRAGARHLRHQRLRGAQRAGATLPVLRAQRSGHILQGSSGSSSLSGSR
jgi:NADP-dependent 3-hydroxy acid dehydrogenase YdfG